MVSDALLRNCRIRQKRLRLRMAFDHRQIAAFLAVAGQGSLGRACETLHVTQPALSRLVQRLEAQVGAPLFERHSKGMALTPVGQALLPHAQLMQREADAAVEEIRALRGLARGTVRVGAIASIATLVLPQAINRLLIRHPPLRVQVLEGVWDRLAEALVKHEIDLALDVDKPDTDDIVAVADCRWEDTSHVVAAGTHPLQRRRGLTLADTLGERWAVTPRGTGPYEHMRQTFAAHGLPVPELAVETRSITMLKSLVTGAGFLSWMAAPIWDAERQAGLIRALPLPAYEARRTLSAFRRRRGLLPAPAQKLVEELRRRA
jgi:DNA-binding transcriptional LysR family regulator